MYSYKGQNFLKNELIKSFLPFSLFKARFLWTRLRGEQSCARGIALGSEFYFPLHGPQQHDWEYDIALYVYEVYRSQRYT